MSTATGDGEGEGHSPQKAIHFQEWWVRLNAAVPAQKFVAVGMDRALPAPGVLEAIREADIIVLPPSNPVVSIGIILGVPGVRDALRDSAAPVVGVSPLISGAPVRGHADACLSAIGVECTTQAVAGLYADFLDGWLVDDADWPAAGFAPGLEVQPRPLWMNDLETAADIAGAAVDLALKLRRTRPWGTSRWRGNDGTPLAGNAAGNAAGDAHSAARVPRGARR